jgi:putative SOS response-associated peptidase YedK
MCSGCLLPANGFYEWRTTAAGAGESQRKQPLHIGMADGSLFGLAGLYERWRGDDDRVLDTCTIVTTAANALVQPIHDRMPLVVAPEDYARWLDPANADVADLIAPYPAAAMALYPVSPRVNSVRHDDASLLEHVDPAAGESAGDHEPPPHPPEQESLF